MKNNNLKKLCLCLSHQIQKDLSLSFDALKRIKKTSKVYKDINANFFVTTGWQYDKHLHEPMCKIMSKYASNILNVDEKNIIAANDLETIYEAPISFFDEGYLILQKKYSTTLYYFYYL